MSQPLLTEYREHDKKHPIDDVAKRILFRVLDVTDEETMGGTEVMMTEGTLQAILGGIRECLNKE